jgi:hypothetical protein
VLLLGFGICGSAFGQGTDTLNVDLAQCIGLHLDADRFACYQERVDAALAAKSPSALAEPENSAGAQSPISAPARRPTPTAAEASVSGGLSSNDAALDQTDESDAGEIFGTITALRELSPDMWVITLDNGQVWQMNQSKPYPLRVGLEARVYETRWGNAYRLSVPEHGGFVQVRRAR